MLVVGEESLDALGKAFNDLYLGVTGCHGEGFYGLLSGCHWMPWGRLLWPFIRLSLDAMGKAFAAFIWLFLNALGKAFMAKNLAFSGCPEEGL